jgi:hypothetical protein
MGIGNLNHLENINPQMLAKRANSLDMAISTSRDTFSMTFEVSTTSIWQALTMSLGHYADQFRSTVRTGFVDPCQGCRHVFKFVESLASAILFR